MKKWRIDKFSCRQLYTLAQEYGCIDCIFRVCSLFLFCLLHKYFILNFVYPIDYANDDNDVDSDMEQTEAETDDGDHDDDDNEAIVDGFIFKLRFYIR